MDSSRLSEDQRRKIHEKGIFMQRSFEICLYLMLLGRVLFILFKLNVDFTPTSLRKQPNPEN